eukprot:g14569.t1
MGVWWVLWVWALELRGSVALLVWTPSEDTRMVVFSHNNVGHSESVALGLFLSQQLRAARRRYPDKYGPCHVDDHTVFQQAEVARDNPDSPEELAALEDAMFPRAQQQWYCDVGLLFRDAFTSYLEALQASPKTYMVTVISVTRYLPAVLRSALERGDCAWSYSAKKQRVGLAERVLQQSLNCRYDHPLVQDCVGQALQDLLLAYFLERQQIQALFPQVHWRDLNWHDVQDPVNIQKFLQDVLKIPAALLSIDTAAHDYLLSRLAPRLPQVAVQLDQTEPVLAMRALQSGYIDLQRPAAVPLEYLVYRTFRFLCECEDKFPELVQLRAPLRPQAECSSEPYTPSNGSIYLTGLRHSPLCAVAATELSELDEKYRDVVILGYEGQGLRASQALSARVTHRLQYLQAFLNRTDLLALPRSSCWLPTSPPESESALRLKSLKMAFARGEYDSDHTKRTFQPFTLPFSLPSPWTAGTRDG